MAEGAKQRNPSFLSWRWNTNSDGGCGAWRLSRVSARATCATNNVSWERTQSLSQPYHFHEFLLIRSKGEVLRIWHFFPILCPSDESLSFDVFVYLRVSLYLVVAIVYMRYICLVWPPHCSWWFHHGHPCWKKKILWKWPTSQRFFTSNGGGGVPPNFWRSLQRSLWNKLIQRGPSNLLDV